jgi:hypothetical protein
MEVNKQKKNSNKKTTEYGMCVRIESENDDWVTIRIRKGVHVRQYITEDTLLHYENTRKRVETLRYVILDSFSKHCYREFKPHTQGSVMKILKEDLEYFLKIINACNNFLRDYLDEYHEYLDEPKPWDDYKDFFQYQIKNYEDMFSRRRLSK